MPRDTLIDNMLLPSLARLTSCPPRINRPLCIVYVWVLAVARKTEVSCQGPGYLSAEFIAMLPGDCAFVYNCVLVAD